MAVAATVKELTYQERLDVLRARKMAHTREKQAIIGAMNYDDWALILPPEEYREVVQTISGSGVAVTEVRLKGLEMVSNHPSGGFFGPKATGQNFRRLLEAHPPMWMQWLRLLGGFLVNFYAYRKVGWNPDFDFSHLLEDIKKIPTRARHWRLTTLCQDLTIGLRLGWGRFAGQDSPLSPDKRPAQRRLL
jgi:hypothetical protein